MEWVPAYTWAVVTGTLVTVAATALFFLAPGRTVNRRLGLVLAAQGVGFLASWGFANMQTNLGAAVA